MNIAVIYPTLHYVGGAENVVIWIVESLAKQGHRVVLFTGEFCETVWGKTAEKPYTVHVLEYKKSRSTLVTNRRAGLALRNALLFYHFDVVNPHNYPASVWVYYAKQQSQNFPKTVLFIHNLAWNFYENVVDVHYRQLPGFRNIWNRYRPKKLMRSFRQIVFGYRRLDQRAVRAFDKVLANGSYTAELASNIFKRDVQACTLGVPVERFHSYGPEAKSGGNTDDSPTLLTVSRIELQKNMDTILNAVKILKNKSSFPPTLKYIIAGNGPFLKHYRKKCHVLGLDEIVQFVGNVPHSDIGKLYSRARFIIHIPLDEPFGLVPLEAALFKKTCIVSDHGGPAATVVNGETGLHVNALDPQDISDKIEFLLADPEKVSKMGEAAYARVLDTMTWDIFLNKFERHLHSMEDKKYQK